MAKHWFDYTPIGWIANGATKLLGLDSNPFSSAMEGVSDTLFGTTYNQDRLQQQQMDFNAAQAQINRDWQKQMMDYQNAYNSPSAMVQRYRDSGLNPSFMMSGSAPAIGSASPSGGSAAISALASAQHGNFSLSDLLLSSQARFLQSQANKFDIEGNVLKEKTPHEINLIDQTIATQKSAENYNYELITQSKVYAKVLGEQAEQLSIDNFVRSQTIHDELRSIKAKGTIDASTAAFIHDELQAQLNSVREYTKLMRSNRFLNSRMQGHMTAMDNYLSHASQQLDSMKEYYTKLGNNIKTSNVIGFINAGSSAINASANLVGKILSRGSVPDVNINKPNTSISSNYNFDNL